MRPFDHGPTPRAGEPPHKSGQEQPERTRKSSNRHHKPDPVLPPLFPPLFPVLPSAHGTGADQSEPSSSKKTPSSVELADEEGKGQAESPQEPITPSAESPQAVPQAPTEPDIYDTEPTGGPAPSTGAGANPLDDADLAPPALKQWISLLGACPVCVANMEVGAIPQDALFPSGDEEPPAHENCRCFLWVDQHDPFDLGNGWALVPGGIP